MSRLMLALTVVLAACVAGSQRQAGCQEGKGADRQWIVGTWRSYKLSYGDFGEWKGAVQMELVASTPKKIGLFLISADGKRVRAGDSQPSIMDDKMLFFGPVGSGLLFHYRRSGDILVLDLKTDGTVIHAELRRENQ